LVAACSVLQSFSGRPLQVSSPPQSCITSFQSVSGAAELGKRLRSSSSMLPNSKLFQKYYWKAREARKVHMEEKYLPILWKL
jgi:hypothetical protein